MNTYIECSVSGPRYPLTFGDLAGMPRATSAARRIGSLAVAALLVLAPAARANELGGNIGWQFPDAAQLAANVAAADMINKYQGGYYKPANFTYNTYNNTSAGNSTNCNLYASTVGTAGPRAGAEQPDSREAAPPAMASPNRWRRERPPVGGVTGFSWWGMERPCSGNRVMPHDRFAEGVRSLT